VEREKATHPWDEPHKFIINDRGTCKVCGTPAGGQRHPTVLQREEARDTATVERELGT
jgi:hypothetical protein